jgi:DNA uptake protein ComE-like DNA-binding protein
MKIKKKAWALSLLKMSRLERISSLLLLSICVILSAILYIRKQKQKDVFISHIRPLALAENNNYADISSSTFNELHPYLFDPNTLDSIGFVELGLREKTIKIICNYRRKGGHFYKPEDFAKVWTLSKQEFAQLRDFIQVASYGSPSKSSYQAIQHIDWNTIDSASLTRVNGIGPYIAHKLLMYRDLLGGYFNGDQLKEAYRLNDTLFAHILNMSSFNQSGIKKIYINSISESDLAKHPYIGDKMGKNILLLRSSFKKFEKIEQLKQVPLMNEEKYRKIAPYIQL